MGCATQSNVEETKMEDDKEINSPVLLEESVVIEGVSITFIHEQGETNGIITIEGDELRKFDDANLLSSASKLIAKLSSVPVSEGNEETIMVELSGVYESGDYLVWGCLVGDKDISISYEPKSNESNKVDYEQDRNEIYQLTQRLIVLFSDISNS